MMLCHYMGGYLAKLVVGRKRHWAPACAGATAVFYFSLPTELLTTVAT